MKHLRTDFTPDECVRLLRAAVRWEQGKREPVRGWVIGRTFRLLQLTPRLYWHCSVCRERFPYYKPTRYGNHLVGEDCLRELKFRRISYVQPKFCSLILPSECPYCGKKFFEYRKEEKA